MRFKALMISLLKHLNHATSAREIFSLSCTQGPSLVSLALKENCKKRIQQSLIQPVVKGNLIPHEIPLEDVNSISENFSPFCKPVLMHCYCYDSYLTLIKRSVGNE